MEQYELEFDHYFDQLIYEYKEGSSRVEAYLPNVAQGYFDFTEACFTEGAMSAKQKQLIALGISIATNDQSCIVYHTKGAVEHGATEEEIIETIAVSAALGGGSAFSEGVTVAIDCFDYYKDTISHH